MGRNDGVKSGARRGKKNKLVARRQRRRRDRIKGRGRKDAQVKAEAKGDG
jgi:hypothetical protein